MNIIKVAAGFVFGLLIVLLILTALAERTEKALYGETVEMLMVQEELSTSEEVIACFPSLKETKAKMNRIAQLSQRIRAITDGPSTDVSPSESQKVKAYAQLIRQLRKSIREDLTQMASAQAIKLP